MSEKAPAKHNKPRDPEKKAHHAYHASPTSESVARLGLKEAVKSAVPTSKLQEELSREIAATLAPQEPISEAAPVEAEAFVSQPEAVPAPEPVVQAEPAAPVVKKIPISEPAPAPVLETKPDPAPDFSSESLSEESEAVLAIEAEDTAGIAQIAPAPEAAPQPVDVSEAPVASPDVAPFKMPESTPEPTPHTTVEAKKPAEYTPKKGDIAEQNGERVRLERPLTADGERVGYEVTKRDGSIDLAPNSELTFIDPEKEVERIHNELIAFWAKAKEPMKRNFSPSYMESIWFDVYENDTINLGIDAGTNPDEAIQKREANRRSLIAGEAALVSVATHTIEHSGDFVISTSTSPKETPAPVMTHVEARPPRPQPVTDLNPRNVTFERSELRQGQL